MKLCLLASGSSGNCAYVAAGKTQILIDAGISVSRVVRELEAIGADPEGIDAVVISHEHSDHCSEVGRIAATFRCPVYLSTRTLPRVRRALTGHERLELFRVGDALAIGDLRLQTVRIFHDAVDPCGFLVEGEGRTSLGIATDLGAVTPPLRRVFQECEALVIEANHDLAMLLSGPYPWDLKQRIRSPVGHLSNDAAAELIADLAGAGRLRQAILAHLSEDNNRPELALEAVRSRLNGRSDCEIALAYRDRRSDVFEV
jgi:phosphoribosyl 1,2-cyclic phosphodiesterase